MRTAAVAFLAAAATAAVLTPLVRDLAGRRGWLDHALDSRKVHGRPVPRLGGVAIVVAFYAPLLALLFVDSEVGHRFWADGQRALGLFAGGLAIAALGVYDDLRGAGARVKFTVQFAVAGALYATGFRIDQIANPFGDAIPLGALGLPFTLLWIAGVVNAMNLVDGLDGLAGGVALVAVGSTFAVAALRAEPLMVLFTAALAGAIVGFLYYNFNPASIFMGDTGSMFLGFVLATTAIQTNQKSATAVAILVPIVALGVPIADTVLAVARRAARGAPLFQADRGHIHHRLLAAGLSHRQAVLVLYGASVVFGLFALVLSHANSSEATLFLLGLSALGAMALRRLGFLDLAAAQSVLAARRRNLEMREAMRRAGEALRRASAPEALWEAVREAAPALGASAVSLRIGRLRWAEGLDGTRPELLRARYGLLTGRPTEDHVELGFSDGRATVDRDTEVAAELLCEHLLVAVERLERGGEAEPQAAARR
ncbi:MAG TPA: MraY family glycosyltransferase [Anaeromyxobacteraceae bacterium]|nr:MraY family glycosyltransferase [Anaeromyxobacteraceae bacterium]